MDEVEKTKLVHCFTGSVGTFVKEAQGYHGAIIIIKLADGREFYAPKREFKQI